MEGGLVPVSADAGGRVAGLRHPRSQFAILATALLSGNHLTEAKPAVAGAPTG